MVYYLNSFFTNFFFPTTYQPWYNFIASLVNVYDNSLFIVLLVSFFTKLFKVFICVLTSDLFDLTSYYAKAIIPTQLSIGYNVIHPVLFYTSFIAIFSIYFNNIFFFKIKSIWYISSIALLLGGLWGLGNSVWGFFWVNDRIELILLCYVVVLLVILHSSWHSILYTVLYQAVWCLFLLILFSRWNFLFTRHSFFNLSNLTNIFIVYLYIYNRYGLLSIFRALIMYCINFLCLLSFVLYFTQLQFKKLNYYSTFLVLLHFFFFILGISWLKYKEHNLIFLTIYRYTYNYYFYLSNNVLFLFNTFYIYGATKLLVFKLSTCVVYSLKLINSIYWIFCSYPAACSTILFLTSILKIYIN